MSMIKLAQRNKEGEKLPTRYYSARQEKVVAKAVSGKQTANSGATMFGGKSDVSIDGLFNIECKTKTKSSDSITIQKSWIDKNEKEALFDGHPYSAIAFNFGPDEKNYYIIDEFLFQTLIEAIKNSDN